MFKKGDVVEFCSETGYHGFDVCVTDVNTSSDAVFSGIVVESDGKIHRVGWSSDFWSTSKFKLKQKAEEKDVNTFPELKDGMVVETRGRYGTYLVCGDKLLRPNGYQWKRDYSASGSTGNSVTDIIKVWSGVSLRSLDFDYYTKNRSDEIIWQENKNAKAIAEIEEQMTDLQQQMSVLQEKLTTLQEEK